MYNLRPRKKVPFTFIDDNNSDHSSEEDPDYSPEDGDDIESDSSSSSSGESEDFDIADLGRNYRMGSSAPTVTTTFQHSKYNSEEKAYLSRLNVPERRKLETLEETIGNTISSELIPLRFRILQAPMEDSIKRHVLNKLNQFSSMNNANGEYYKLKNWLENVSHLPFSKFVNLPVNHSHSMEEINTFMQNTRSILEQTVYGHQDTKLQIMRIVAQWISNPSSYGHAIGIHGPPGVGKTQLIKNGLSKALGIPFGFIALGGCSDGSFLEGHSYTYEGSTYGKISEILIKTQCSNPIIFFDELDKVSLTKKGDEIIGILTHLTDPIQNEKFNDKYFVDVDINLSRSLIIFSYNDETAINPILKDRLITIKVDGYKKSEKKIIARDYLFPDICKAFGLGVNDIIIEDSTFEFLIDNVEEEKGVRNLKRGIEYVVSLINLERWQPNTEVKLPFKVTNEFIIKNVKKYSNSEGHPSMYM